MRSMTMNMGTTKALRAASGNLAARRGSTLILVVATLALLAVLTVAYVSIGGGDRRSARTTTRAAEIDRQAQHIGDYIVGIIGDDALAVYFEGFDPDGEPVFMTEAVDVPRTDFNRTFDGNSAPGTTPDPQDNYYGLAFTPSGSLPPLRPDDSPTQQASNLFTAGGDLKPFGPSDPFLAASEPTYIREVGGAFNSPAYEDRVDWAKISNIGPNGVYVNLWNLRANFDAEPGFSTEQMSDRTTMFVTDRNGDAVSDLVYGIPAEPEIPAHFDSMLVGAFQPINFVPSGVEIQDPEYPGYSWADADGDGYFDSRWQELVDITVPGNPRRVVPNEGQLRWFVAARIIDLSGRVNVNTARGILQPLASGTGADGTPTNGNRLGASPADIALFRLLTLENNLAMFDEFYDTAVQPGSGAEDYSDYNDFSVSKAVGTQGYWGVRRVLTGEQPPAGPLTPGVDPQLADDRRAEFSILRRGGDTPLRTDFDGVYRQHAFGLEDLSDLLAFNGLNNPLSLSSLERAAGGRDASDPNFSPMRENRSLQWERALPDDPTDTAPLGLRHTSVRKDLTTLSGGIPRVPWRVRYTSASPTALDVFTSFSSLPESTIALDPASENPVVLQDGYRLLGLGAPNDLPIGSTVGEAQARLIRNAHPLLRTYGNALMPAAGEPGAWSTAEWDSTFYGFDPLFALRTSAHVVANMIDAFDGDDIPSAYTVLVQGDSATRATLESDATAMAVFPWWSEPEPSTTNPGVSGRLDMGEERLPTPADNKGVVAMNVYGLEVHPFITQVSLYNIFTDTPEAAGGDAEYVPPTGGGGGTIFGPGGGGTSNPVTIDFDTDPAGNDDFVGQLFAVQLTNPYTTDIVVRDNQFYVRFGELGGPVTSPALADGLEVPAGTRIPAGESVVFYAHTNGLPARASSAAAFVSVSSGLVQSWMNLHLTGDPNTEAIEFATPMIGVGDFLGGVAGAVAGDADANREITLWTRLNRDGGEVSDVMLDRLYDPADLSARPTLDRRPPAVNTDIDVTTAGPETTGSAADAIDNTGFSIVTWATIARPTGDVEAPQGALPAYILEKPFSSSGMSFNRIADDGLMLPAPPSPGVALNRGHFVGGGKLASAERYLADIFSHDGGSTGAMAQIPTDITLQAGVVDPANPHQHRYVIQVGDQRDLLAFDDLYANPFRNDNRGQLSVSSSSPAVRMLRPGDFLGVPAVGPVQMPASVSGGVDPLDLDWFTTGELLTLALGYDLAPPTGSAFFYPGLPEDSFSVLDRGHLSLDLPAPYVDRDGSGDFSPGDERRGLGVPHAMAVTSSITTLDVPINTRTPIAGLVNINTATEAATSVLPGLTPTYETTIDPTLSWINDGTVVLHDHQSDVAAGIRSYRDRSAARTRRGTTTVAPFYEPSSWGDSDPRELDDRQVVTGIDGLREDTGFLSVGEMLAADTLPTSGGLGSSSGYPRPHMIRRLGQDQLSLSVDGVDAVRYTAGGAVDVLTAGPGFDDGVVDDYDEQLALFNGVANTVTVRSDVYAVWFVMHGYAREDVEGLRPDDPMVPSVARRYLMIVDRSNVRRAGDKPRVLLFDELPL